MAGIPDRVHPVASNLRLTERWYDYLKGLAGTPTDVMTKAVYDADNDGVVDAAEVANSVAWANITGVPATFPPSTHNHDDRYYTETEIDTLFGGYYTKTAADALLLAKQAADSDLTALAGNTSNGLWARTGTGTGAARTITGTADEITLTNGDGVSGNPTASLPSALTFTGKTVTGGVFQSLTSLAIGTSALSGYKMRLVGGNADQMVLDNTGQQYTELDYANNGVLKALTFWDNSNNAFVFRTLGTSGRIRFDTNAVDRVFFEPNGSVLIGNAIGSTTATDGFLYIQACAGVPTGVPTAYAGRVPLRYDSTNNNLYIYNGGTWKKTTVFA